MITLTPLKTFDVPVVAEKITPFNFKGKTTVEIGTWSFSKETGN